MARAKKLKVFRTPIGFHDAYVAAPSQKAALEAWGADSNLFASGSAEQVEDPELTLEPLASPGRVIRRLRGTWAEHVAALPKTRAAATGKNPQPKPAPADPASVPARKLRLDKPKPRPSRMALDRAEAALVDLDAKHAQATANILRRQKELDRLRETLEAQQERERKKLLHRVQSAGDKYERSMQAWRDD